MLRQVVAHHGLSTALLLSGTVTREFARKNFLLRGTAPLSVPDALFSIVYSVTTCAPFWQLWGLSCGR